MQKSFITILTNSPERSLAFYCEILGFKLQHRIKPSEAIELIWLKNENDMVVELVYNPQMGEIDNTGASITLTFQVDDLENRRQLLLDHHMTYHTHMLPNGSTVHKFRDPNGTAIAFMGKMEIKQI